MIMQYFSDRYIGVTFSLKSYHTKTLWSLNINVSLDLYIYIRSPIVWPQVEFFFFQNNLHTFKLLMLLSVFDIQY